MACLGRGFPSGSWGISSKGLAVLRSVIRFLPGMAIGTTIAAAETRRDSLSHDWRSAPQLEEQNSRKFSIKNMRLKPDEPPSTIEEPIAQDVN
jgi:hypothetical protein